MAPEVELEVQTIASSLTAEIDAEMYAAVSQEMLRVQLVEELNSNFRYKGSRASLVTDHLHQTDDQR